MALGQEINLYFTQEEPWAVFKKDPDAAAKVIAATSMAISLIALIFKPFLPTLSESILGLYSFEEKLSTEEESALYQGDIEVMRRLAGKIKLESTPQILVPKIEESSVEGL